MQELSSITEAVSPALKAEAQELLKKLIALPSFSKEEDKTANLLLELFKQKNIAATRKMNNVWTVNKHFDSTRPIILLNSHHDTVRPNDAYTKDPFQPSVNSGKLFGLGSNDAGASLVSLLATFLHFYERGDLKYNLVFCASAEEEISGKNGIATVIPHLPPIEFAIVGEPTLMQMAVAEKGLVVLDCTTYGKAGHAAREEGENAIYKALKDIQWFQNFKFPKESESLGPVKMSVTVLHAGTQHNIVPSSCHFAVDIRTTDTYSNEEIINIIKQNVSCEVSPRSLRLQPSSISATHPFVVAGKKHGLSSYGSPTLSDQALMPWPSVKIGPGDSARSHMADEYVYLEEIDNGIDTYVKILSDFIF
jgi:acetylornithine deacetylase